MKMSIEDLGRNIGERKAREVESLSRATALSGEIRKRRDPTPYRYPTSDQITRAYEGLGLVRTTHTPVFVVWEAYVSRVDEVHRAVPEESPLRHQRLEALLTSFSTLIECYGWSPLFRQDGRYIRRSDEVPDRPELDNRVFCSDPVAPEPEESVPPWCPAFGRGLSGSDGR